MKNISSKNIDNRDKVAIIEVLCSNCFTTDVVGKRFALTEINIQFRKDMRKRVIKKKGWQTEGVCSIYNSRVNYGDRTVDMIVYDNSVYAGSNCWANGFAEYYSVNLNGKNQTSGHFSIFYTLQYLSDLALLHWSCGIGSVENFEEIKENLKLNYFLKSLKNIPLKYVALVLVFAGIPAVLLIVFNICDFSIFIPSKYIPNVTFSTFQITWMCLSIMHKH